MNDLAEYVGKGALIGVGCAVALVTLFEIVSIVGSIAVDSYSVVVTLAEQHLGSWGRDVAILAPIFASVGMYLGIDLWRQQRGEDEQDGQ